MKNVMLNYYIIFLRMVYFYKPLFNYEYILKYHKYAVIISLKYKQYCMIFSHKQYEKFIYFIRK